MSSLMETAAAERDLLVPRPLDLPTEVPLDAGADLSVLDEAKILAAPRDPADLPRWRDVLTAWRSDARQRMTTTAARMTEGPAQGPRAVSCRAWSGCGTSGSTTGRPTSLTVEEFLAYGGREFGGFDASCSGTPTP